MRLIDAKMYCMELYNEMNYPGRSEEFMTAIDVAIADLADAPTVDAVPVRHGRWVDKQLIKSFKHTNIPVVECSACGIDFCDIINNHYFMYNYCPNCGAKMDGELNE